MAIPRNLANIAPHMNASSTELVVNDGGADLNFRVEGDSDANLLFVDAGAENVGIGTNTPAVKLHVAGTGNANSIMTNQVFRIVGGGNALNFGDDGTDSLIGVGNSSSNISILSRVAGVYSKTLTVNSDSTIKTAATISVGNATPSTSGAGITFPATQSASTDANTLDDYEEGTWTPVLAGREGSVSGQSYSQQIGKYTKIGNVVYVVCDVILSAEGTPGTGSSGIRGLPFTVGATNGSGMCCTTWTNTGQNYVSIVAIAVNAETNAIFKVATAATNSNAVVDPPTDFFTNTTRIALMGFYYVS